MDRGDTLNAIVLARFTEEERNFIFENNDNKKQKKPSVIVGKEEKI